MELFIYENDEHGLNREEIIRTIRRSLEGRRLNKVLLIPPDFTRFSGTLKYKAKISLDKIPEFLDLGELGELAELFVNGVSCGVALNAPFRFCVKDAWRSGVNEVEILVATSCAYRRRDIMSALLPLPPMGILGPIRYV